MTLEEKRQKIRQHCESWPFPCERCPVSEVIEGNESCYEHGFGLFKEPDIERNYKVLFGDDGENSDDDNPYWERICKLADKQRAKGMKTYGQGLESNPAAICERINHLQEELIDALMYCEWIKDKIEEMMNQKGTKA